jgi:hypothetical protein
MLAEIAKQIAASPMHQNFLDRLATHIVASYLQKVDARVITAYRSVSANEFDQVQRRNPQGQPRDLTSVREVTEKVDD